MDDTTSFILEQADEDNLTYTVSDEALEAAAAASHHFGYRANSYFTDRCFVLCT